MSESITLADYPGLHEDAGMDNIDAETAEQPTEAPEADQQEAASETPSEAPEAAADDPGEDHEDDTKRAARLAQELRAARRRARVLEAEAQALRGERQLSHDESVEVEVNRRMATAQQQDAVQERSRAILQEGRSAYGNSFDDALRDLASGMTQDHYLAMTDAVLEVPDAHKLVMHLANNPDIADRIAGMTPTRMGVALANEAAKLAKPKPKPVSKATPPITPVKTAPVGGGADTSDEDAWFAKEQERFIKRMGY